VLSVLAREVYSIERIAALGAAAGALLARLGYKNVHARVADGYAGWREHAPFDRIIATASPPEVPPELVAQLAEGGVMVTPIGEMGRSGQRLIRVRKVHGQPTIEELCAVSFVPMVEGSDPGEPSWN
jgi:protein-L-isoaspartate(D-aspartate) O-methyltransferase